jgi:hypothetical protein
MRKQEPLMHQLYGELLKAKQSINFLRKSIDGQAPVGLDEAEAAIDKARDHLDLICAKISGVF